MGVKGENHVIVYILSLDTMQASYNVRSNLLYKGH